MNKLITFLRDVRLELKRVTWPNKDQIMSATVVVIVATLILSAYLGMVDKLFSVLLRLALR